MRLNRRKLRNRANILHSISKMVKTGNFTIYTIPGLGLDERIFGKIDFGQIQVRHLNWIVPERDESIADYAKRMTVKIEKTNEKIILIGHSFGGIMAQEMAQFIDIEKIILVSSIKSIDEKPWHIRLIEPLGLYRFFTKKLTLSTFWIWAKQHGYRTGAEQQLFKNMIGKQPDDYLQWAIKTLSKWSGPSRNNIPVVQIHGENDKTFPIHLLKQPLYRIKDGSHFMVFSQPDIVGKMILEAMD